VSQWTIKEDLRHFDLEATFKSKPQPKTATNPTGAGRPKGAKGGGGGKSSKSSKSASGRSKGSGNPEARAAVRPYVVTGQPVP
jgi:hypothetical protein